MDMSPIFRRGVCSSKVELDSYVGRAGVASSNLLRLGGGGAESSSESKVRSIGEVLRFLRGVLACGEKYEERIGWEDLRLVMPNDAGLGRNPNSRNW